jgi:cold shock CspA family protein
MSDTINIYHGRVKWFNNKTGYGFISVTSGDRSGTDLFVHHTSIDVADMQYKYLVQGEYVEFEIINAETSDHEYQTRNVRGISGGKLMCETRREMRTNHVGYHQSNSNDKRVTKPRRDQKEWSFVEKKSSSTTL